MRDGRKLVTRKDEEMEGTIIFWLLFFFFTKAENDICRRSCGQVCSEFILKVIAIFDLSNRK